MSPFSIPPVGQPSILGISGSQNQVQPKNKVTFAGASSDQFTASSVDRPNETKGTTPIINTVPVTRNTGFQARSLAEIMTILDRRTGYIQKQAGGLEPFGKLDGGLKLEYPDGTKVELDLTVPPQLADTHDLVKDRGLAGGNGPFNRPYKYTAVPASVVGSVPTYANNNGGFSYNHSHFMASLRHAFSQGERGVFVEIGNRPALRVRVTVPEGQMYQFTIDPNVKAKDGAPNMRVVNFIANEVKAVEEGHPPDSKALGAIRDGETGPGHQVLPLEVTPEDQLALVEELVPALYQHVPQHILADQSGKIAYGNEIEPGNAGNEFQYTYPDLHGSGTSLRSLATQYRYFMGHYAAPKE